MKGILNSRTWLATAILTASLVAGTGSAGAHVSAQLQAGRITTDVGTATIARTVSALQERVSNASRNVGDTTRSGFVLVSRSGRILAQSGGISATHPATGAYSFVWDMKPGGCSTFGVDGAMARRRVGDLAISSPRTGRINVLRRVRGQLRDGAFYLLLSC